MKLPPETPIRVQTSRSCTSKQQARDLSSSLRTTKSSKNKPAGRRTHAIKSQNKRAMARELRNATLHAKDATQTENTVTTPSGSSSISHIHLQTTAIPRRPTLDHKTRMATVLREGKRRKPHPITDSPESHQISLETTETDHTVLTDMTQEDVSELGSANPPGTPSSGKSLESKYSVPGDVESKAKPKVLVGNTDPSQMADPALKDDEGRGEVTIATLSGRSPSHAFEKAFNSKSFDAFYSKFPLEVPKGHKFIHIMRHCRSWQNLSPRNDEEDLELIHDPGLSPGGIKDARNFRKIYRNLRNPTLIVTSPLRRCLQTTVLAFGDQIKAGKLRAIASPNLQEVSTYPCDTGSPLDVLREEFPLVEFPDELFPDVWPRDRNITPRKSGTTYDDSPSLLANRELQVREWLRTLDDSEIVVVTHGSFAHFLLNEWTGEPGNSESRGYQLENGETIPMTLPDKSLPMTNFQHCGTLIHIRPNNNFGSTMDEDPKVYLYGSRDCGIFTPYNLR